jgi:poly-gamma-glutamate capsule biosynthesis protein CapA/YwtB (metallophosphatase superfamily)
MIRIIIGGDTGPIGCNQMLFQEGNAEVLLGDLLTRLGSVDLFIANLECPLIEKETPILKCGPTLGAPVVCVNGLSAMGIDIVGLANNHIMDHGRQGLQSTLAALEREGIGYVGAGKNLEEAHKILVRQVGGMRIGVLALAEHEFGIAGREVAGANPLDVIDVVRNISEHRAEFDYLVVLLHGGNEYYPYPRPNLMDTCRFLVEIGANVVVCQHSHCAGCLEVYRGSPIVYGQGNLLFDYPSNESAWHEGVLVSLAINDNTETDVQLIPYLQSDAQPGIHTMPYEATFLSGFLHRSRNIADESFVLAQWQRFCRDKKRHHLHLFNYPPGLLRRVLGRLDLLHFLDSPDKQRVRLNAIRCESLREVLIALLSEESGK